VLEVERERYTTLIRQLWGIVPRAHSGVVQLAPEARLRFNAWRRENATERKAFGEIEPALGSHLAKYPTLALRLALTFHCAYIVTELPARDRDPAPYPIDVDTLELAFKFLRRAGQHALALYLNRKGGSDAYELARDVAGFIVSRTATENAIGFQRRDLIARVSGYRSADEPVQAIALRLLVDLGWIRVVEGGYAKAQPTRYAINPRVADLFARESERERERRALVRERLAEVAVERRGD
jgi:hypothetical protein